MVRLPPALRPLYPIIKKSVVATTRVAAPASARISLIGAGRVPGSAVGTLEEAAEASGGRFAAGRPAETIRRPAHLGRPARLAPLEPAIGDVAPRTGVAELPRGRVLGPHHAVITGDDRLVDEVSRYFVTTRPREHPIYLNPFPGAPTHVAGRVAVLACRGDANYYHFLVDAMSRLGVLEDAGLLDTVDRFYVPTAAPFQRELLDMLGVAPDRRIDAATVRHIRADVLLVPSLPALHEVNPPWVVNFLRRRLLRPRPGPPSGRLYLSRGQGANNRIVRNEDEVVHFLLRRGFTVVDPGTLPVRRQIALFADARVVVAPHGAALTNLAFLPEGSGVVELFPAGGVLPDYWRLVSAVPEVQYRYLSTWPRGRPLTRQRAIVSDIDVDIDDLAALLDEVS